MEPATCDKLTPAETRVVEKVRYACRELNRAWKTEQAYIGQIVGYLTAAAAAHPAISRRLIY